MDKPQQTLCWAKQSKWGNDIQSTIFIKFKYMYNKIKYHL